MQSTPIPSLVSTPAVRAYKYLTKPYEELARSLGNPDALQQCLQRNQGVYVEDKNVGLINQVLERQEMRSIAALQDTFVAISLEEVAKRVCYPQATPTAEDIQRMENLIVRMVSLCPEFD